MIFIKNSEKIKIHNLFLDGNGVILCNFPNGEQANNIRIRNSKDILIEDICSINTSGDALNIGCSDQIIVQDNYFDFAERNGLTIGFNGDLVENPCFTNDLKIRRNYFGKEIDTQCIDFEHGSQYTGVEIIDNDFEERPFTFATTDDRYAIAVSRFKQHANISNVIARNRFNGNRLSVRSSEKISIRFNKKIGQTKIQKGTTISTKDIIIRGNTFEIKPTYNILNKDLEDQGVLIRFDGTENIQLNNNVFEISNFERGIEIRNADSIQVQNNQITNTTSNGNNITSYGIRLRAEFADTTTATLHGNTISGWSEALNETCKPNSLTCCYSGNNCYGGNNCDGGRNCD